jgi:hypothetical protein
MKENQVKAMKKKTVRLKLSASELTTLAMALGDYIENLRDGLGRDRDGATEEAAQALQILRQLGEVTKVAAIAEDGLGDLAAETLAAAGNREAAIAELLETVTHKPTARPTEYWQAIEELKGLKK